MEKEPFCTAADVDGDSIASLFNPSFLVRYVVFPRLVPPNTRPGGGGVAGGVQVANAVIGNRILGGTRRRPHQATTD